MLAVADDTSLWVAGIGAVAVISAAAIPAWMNARKTRHAIGTPNGQGTVVEMLEKALEGQGELRAQVGAVKTQIEFVSSVQEQHALEDSHNQQQTEKHFRVVFNHLEIPYDDEESPDDLEP